MARIDLSDFDELKKERMTLQEKVPASWSAGIVDGEKVLQIETYGKNGSRRKECAHPTQVLQLDRPAMLRLLKLMVENDLL